MSGVLIASKKIAMEETTPVVVSGLK